MMNRREGALRAAFALFGALAMGGCDRVHYPAHYILNFEPSVQAPAPARSIGTVAVAELGCPDYHCADRIVYRPTPAEVAFYEYHRWAVSPREMVAHYLADRVRSRSVFVSVTGADSHVATDFVLNGMIDRLEEVDDGRRVAAVCALSAQLRDTRTGSVVWTSTITERVALEQRDVAGLPDDGSAKQCRSARRRPGTRARTKCGTAVCGSAHVRWYAPAVIVAWTLCGRGGGVRPWRFHDGALYWVRFNTSTTA